MPNIDVNSNSAWESVLRVDSAVQTLQANIRDRILELGTAGTAPPGTFDIDAYFTFVRAWNEYKAGVDRRKTWVFSPVEVVDTANVYWALNLEWRKKAESGLGLAIKTTPDIPPADPLPKDDPRRKGYPYEGTLKIVGVGVILYLIARMMGKV